jgi:hypothetical protein
MAAATTGIHALQHLIFKYFHKEFNEVFTQVALRIGGQK